MTMLDKVQRPLEGYRVLDLTDEKGFMAGKILADLGAEVILVEPPEGNPARCREIYNDKTGPHRETLYWLAFNTGKKSVVLDITKQANKNTYLELVRTADVIIESFPSGWLESMEIGYETLREINSRLILTSITPFGQTGPYKSFQASDLINMAMGGMIYITGDPDRPPLRIGLPQSYLHAGLHAAAGTLVALQSRERLGVGQWVDVSIHESIVRCLTHDMPMWEFGRDLMRRSGAGHFFGKLPYREIWPCADGAVAFRVVGGVGGRRIGYMVNWMRQEGMAGVLGDLDWDRINLADTTPEEMDSWDRAFMAFFARHTRSEIYSKALDIGLPLCPVNNIPEVMVEPQLMFRKYWAFLEHPDLKSSIPYPGVPYSFSLTPAYSMGRAPQVGQDTNSILQDVPKREMSQNGMGLAAPLGDSHGALTGLKILDLTHQLTGPLITKYLGDFGATVIKVESSSRPDLTRVSQPFQGGSPGINLSGSFVNYNTNKLSLGLDLKHPEAKALIKKLVKWADVFVENLGPGAVAKLGLDYATVNHLNPNIIMLSTSAQGQGGPSSSAPGYGWNLNGLSGFIGLAGWPDRQPVSPHVAYTDVIAPGYGVIAILSALDYRRRFPGAGSSTGRGQYIDLSQLEAGLSFLSPALLNYAINGASPQSQGNHSPGHVPHNVYLCKGDDRWCAITVSDEPQWLAFVRAMGNPDWCHEERFQSVSTRRDNEEEMDTLISAWTIEHEPPELMHRLQSAGVPAGMVQTAADIWSGDPQIQHRQYLVSRPHKAMGSYTFQSWPAKLSLTPALPGASPCLGEHTEYICRNVLDLSGEELTDLIARGVVETG